MLVRNWILAGLAMLGGVAGCPSTGDDQGPVTAVISLSSSRGSPPLTVTASASESTSVNPIASYLWDFAGQAQSTEPSATHVFTTPGRFSISLTVTDAEGNVDTSRAEVQLRGADPTAVIVASNTAGDAPLTVQFDGTQSTAPDDTIFDYFWDFDDGSESRRASPIHTFLVAGTYNVSLRVVTGGGAEHTTTTTITVGTSTISLQFNGSQFATLPTGVSSANPAFTFETWIKPADGGTVATFGSPSISIDVLPSLNEARVRIGSTTTTFNAFNTAGRWQFLALSYDAASGATLFLDGVPLGSAPAGGDISVPQITLGGGFRGNLARVRFWTTSRSGDQVRGDDETPPAGGTTGLVGDWPTSEGSGQSLRNTISSANNGVLGASSSSEGSDPAWSDDGP